LLVFVFAPQSCDSVIGCCCSAYDYTVPAQGKIVAKTDIQIALPEGCYGRIGGLHFVKS